VQFPFLADIQSLIHFGEAHMQDKAGKTVSTGFGNQAASPVIDPGKCTNCGMCVKICPSVTIINVSGQATVVPDNGMGCFACGQCTAICAFDAVRVTGRRMTPDDVQPWPASDRTADDVSLHNLMLTRRSVRTFKDAPVERELIDRILEMTASAPMGIAPSDVECTVFLGRDRVQAFAGDLDGVFRKWNSFFNPVTMFFMRVFGSKAAYQSFDGFLLPIIREMIHAREHGSDMLFYDAPCVLLFTTHPMADPIDGTIACTYAMLAAQSLGLGTCMIGTVAHAVNMDKKVKARWGIPADHKACLAMVVGHPAHRYHRVVKRTLAAIHIKD